MSAGSMSVQHFFDPATSTLSYVVHDDVTRDAVVIDPVLDYDPQTSQTSTASVEAIFAHVRAHGLRVHYVLDTHPHADHLSGTQWLKRRLGARGAIGDGIRAVQVVLRDLLGLPADFAVDGRQFDRLLHDGEVVEAGALAVHVLATPGHTPACLTYRIRDAVFTGDALFLPDYGTARCDFPAGDAATLYASVHDRLYALPDDTRVFVGHDYQPGGREVRWQTTIGQSKRDNVQLRATTARDEFVRFRRDRDRTLAPPRLYYPSIQVNVNAGRLPAARADGRRFLSIPINPVHPTDDDGGELR
ncbi:MAG TPA: MBL fold metallo-hydrolase [Kofleriaceae bacterium]|jgi:glyoxylase-like metal-dependent hydrolase (beta-lactamase superfamily II)|nr:MBL fold metallo-hydrolase [Kofleriaceae bacterium]